MTVEAVDYFSDVKVEIVDYFADEKWVCQGFTRYEGQFVDYFAQLILLIAKSLMRRTCSTLRQLAGRPHP